MVLAVKPLDGIIVDRVDLVHGDPSTDGGGDGHGDAGGDGLNLSE